MAKEQSVSDKPSVSRARKLLSVKNAIKLAFVAVIVAAVFSTNYVSIKDSVVDPRFIFNAESYTNANFATNVEPRIEDRAVDLATLVTAIQADEEKAKADYGNSDNPNNKYSYPVTFTAVAGEATGQIPGTSDPESMSIIPLTVEGISSDIQVELQVALIKGTAIRDVTGTVNINQFLNQTEFLKVSQAFNDHVKEYVIDPFLEETTVVELEGKTIQVTGAFINNKNLELISVVPISIELVS